MNTPSIGKIAQKKLNIIAKKGKSLIEVGRSGRKEETDKKTGPSEGYGSKYPQNP